jgi:hypothetical protein
MTPARLLYVLALVTALALALVWQSARVRQAGYRAAELRAQIAEQKAERAVHGAHLSKLRSPQRVVSLVRWLGLELEERTVALSGRPDRAAPRPQGAEPAPGGDALNEEPVAALGPF